MVILIILLIQFKKTLAFVLYAKLATVSVSSLLLAVFKYTLNPNSGSENRFKLITFSLLIKVITYRIKFVPLLNTSL